MQPGYNSDITFQGRTYHVQTEDWGEKNPYLVSRVFSNGAVLKSIRTSYAELLSPGLRSNPQAIAVAIREQHEQILQLLKSGQLL